ncbi:hypothetical protein KJ780_00475 [Candidatus Micrarchaeota archaeon]|nr:hypothetical protein [Candidatus Micrarchaeota archaeon]
MPKVCIVCTNEVQGNAYPVKDDRIIKAIRKVKATLGMAKNNELYVCEECFPKYEPKRKKFEKQMVYSIALAALIIVFVIGLQIISGGLNLMIMFFGLLMGLGIILMAMLIYFTPALEKEVEKQKKKKGS